MSNRRPTLLVLAASIYQLDAIRTARRLGYRVVTVDNIPSNPGHALADRSYHVDTTDFEGVLAVAKSEQVSGVLAACTDVAVPTAAYVAESLGLPGQPLRSAQVLTSKVEFRRFLASNGFPTPQAHPVTLGSGIPDGLFTSRAWLLKPDRSSGSKGVFIVNSEQVFQTRLPETIAFSPNRAGVLEEFIVGHQGTCEGVLRDGDIAVSFVLDRQTAPPPYATTVGHRLPSVLSERDCGRLLELITRVFHKLNIREAVFDCDFVAAAGEVFLLEISPRVGGNSITKVLRQAAGFDLMEFAIRQACGEKPQPPVSLRVKPTAVVLLGVWNPGRLQYSPSGVDALRREAWVESLTMDLPFGSPVRPFINGRHRVGEAIIFGDDRTDLENKAAAVSERLALTAI